MTLATDLGREVVRAYLPLERALRSGYELRALLRDMGWHLDLSAITDHVAAAVPGAATLAGAVPDAVAAMGTLSHGHDDQAALELADAAVRIVDAVTELAGFDPAGLVPDGAGRIADADFWVELAADLPEYLLLRWLREYHPVLRAALRLAGVVEDAVRPGLPTGVDTPHERLVWDRLVGLAGGDTAVLAGVYGWGGALDHARLVGALRDLAAAVGAHAVLTPVPEALVGPGRPYAEGHPALASARALDVALAHVTRPDGTGVDELGVVVTPVPHPTPAAEVGALDVTVRSAGGRLGPFDLGAVELDLSGAGDALASSGLELSPSGVAPVGPQAATLDVSWSTTGGEPLRFPMEGSPALAIGAASAGVAIAAGSPPELRLVASLTGGQLVLVGGDALLATVLGAGELAVTFDVDLAWSSVSGLTVGGSAGLAVTIPIDRDVGPVHLERLRLAAEAGDGGEALLTGALDLTGALGPLSVGVDGIGLALALVPTDEPGGFVGPVDLAIRPVPPDGLALSLDAPMASGGGRISVDAEEGRWEGALDLEIAGVGVGVTVVVGTKVPGDPGWAFFGSIGATFPAPGLPLGFGFSLTGVGGVLAVNRALDAEALALGLREGALDALLFPDDPVRDAEVLLANLDDYFPIAPGNTVVGPVVEISWGVPTLITGQLGVVISLPQGVIAVLGSVEALLPVADAPLLELHLDTLGVIDVGAGTLLVAASVYDSRLLGFIELSGDAAVYLSVGNEPYFMLSVGGFHPGFQPPSMVPSVFGSLRRLRADVDLGVGVTASITAYFAITPNSLQMGGGFELAATADVALATYTARGWFEFDLLLQLDPFLLVADVAAGVGVYAGDRELMGVQLDAHVEGPEPWFAAASASFKFFGIKVNFGVTVGGHAPPEVPDRIDVHELVAAQLELDEAWSAERAGGARAGVVLRDGVDDELLRPDDRLVVRQRVAPLDRTLECYGPFAPEQSTISLGDATLRAGDGTTLSGVTTAPVEDWFAPAEFSVFGVTERLSAPSYELMRAGLAFGAAGVEVPAASLDQLAMPPGHETEIWEPSTGRVQVWKTPVTAVRSTEAAILASAGARTATTVRGARLSGLDVAAGAPARGGAATAARPVAVASTSYVVVDGLTGAATSSGTDYATALRSRRAGGGRVRAADGRNR